MKIDGWTFDRRTLEKIRIAAVDRVRGGEAASKVMAGYGFCRTTIYKWLDLAQQSDIGINAPLSTKGTGRPRSLTPEQEKQVFFWIDGHDPRKYGFEACLWTRSVVSEMIAKEFGVKLGLTAIGTLLANIGLTPQKPGQRALARNEAEVLGWKMRTWPAKSERHDKNSRNAHLVFIDECGFMLAPLVRRTWAPRGHTPVIKVAEPHGRISAIGAITISPARSRFRFYFHLLPDNANYRGDTIVAFLESLRRRIRKPHTIIWDQIPIHQSYQVERYLSKHKEILAEPFPPYAPELNPVDRVWGYVKYGRLANYCPMNLDELRETVTCELHRVATRTDMLKSFLHATGLEL